MTMHRTFGRVALGVAVLAMALGLGGCDAMLAEALVNAPNKGKTAAQMHPTEGWALGLMQASEERFIEVGPPAATIRVLRMEPTREAMLIDGEPRGTVLLLHGYRNNAPLFTFKGREFTHHGYRAIVIELRGHGKSTGDYITFGAHESRDIVQVVDALERRGWITGKLGVWGISMGASTAIQYAARDERVDAVVAISPYANMREVAGRAVASLAPWKQWPNREERVDAVIDQAGEQGGFDPDAADTLAAMRRLDAPVLIVHGEWDAVIPVSHGQRLADAAHPGCRFVRLPLIGHLGAGVDPLGQIADESTRWFDQHLAGLPLDTAPAPAETPPAE